MKDDRYFLVIRSPHYGRYKWTTVKGAQALAKHLEPVLATWEDDLAKRGHDLKFLKKVKSSIRQLLEDPAAGRYKTEGSEALDLGYSVPGLNAVWPLPAPEGL